MSYVLPTLMLMAVSLGLTSAAGGVSECSPTSGPAGINRCILANVGYPYYNDYQWATCLTNAYIKQKSSGRHACVSSSAIYCWYQCMLETYGSLGPEVNGVCLCNGNTTYSTVTPSGSTLPPLCYSPDGTDCRWYADCLEAKYPCRGTGAGYAIEYATKFCNLYTQNIGDFSAVGQRWVAATRKCLQVALVPLLRQYWTPTCSDIRSTAFNSHTPCYLRPETGAPSVCDLPLADYFSIMWTIKSAFVDPTTAGESLCGGLDVFRDCKNQWKDTRPCLRAFVIDVGILYGKVLPPAADIAIMAAKIIKEIGGILKWDSQKLKYLGCLTEWLEPERGLLNIILAVPDHVNCLKSLVSSTSRRAVSSVNLDDVEREFENAVRNGSLLVSVDGVNVYVKAIGQCDPLACNNVTATNITAPPPPTTPTSPKSAASILSSTWLAVIVVILNSLIVSKHLAAKLTG